MGVESRRGRRGGWRARASNVARWREGTRSRSRSVREGVVGGRTHRFWRSLGARSVAPAARRDWMTTFAHFTNHSETICCARSPMVAGAIRGIWFLPGNVSQQQPSVVGHAAVVLPRGGRRGRSSAAGDVVRSTVAREVCFGASVARTRRAGDGVSRPRPLAGRHYFKRLLDSLHELARERAPPRAPVRKKKSQIPRRKSFLRYASALGEKYHGALTPYERSVFE